MGKDLNLRQYQEDILARLQSVVANKEESSSRLGITVGKYNLLINLSDISEVSPISELHTVPLTASWFLGVSNVRGNLYGISDLAQLTNQPAISKSASSRVLLVNQEIVPQVGLLIDRLVGLRTFDQFKIKKSKKVASPWFKPYIYTDADGMQWYEFDCYALMSSKEFMQPTQS